MLALLKDVPRPPSRILLENVKGFETSCARAEVLQVLCAKGYFVKEFLLCPSQLGVPNSRLRYYLLAALTPSSDHSPESERAAPNEEVSKTFPLCLCLPWVQKAKENVETSKTCSRCGKTIVPKASTLLEKFHSNALREHSDEGGIENYEQTHGRPALDYSAITLRLAQFLDCGRSSSTENCGYCTDSLKETSGQNAHHAVAASSVQTCVPAGIDNAASVADSTVSRPVVSVRAADSSPKGPHGIPSPAANEKPVSVFSCKGYCRYLLKEKLLTKYGRLLDVVDDSSMRTCCFTKGYGRLVEGTGSVFNPSGKGALDDVFSRVSELEKCLGQPKVVSRTSVEKNQSLNDEHVCEYANTAQHHSNDVTSSGSALNLDTKNGCSVPSSERRASLEDTGTQSLHSRSNVSDSCLLLPSSSLDEHTSSKASEATVSSSIEQACEERSRLLLSLGLRYFTPREALRLMGFPGRFMFPDHLSCRQQQQLIGNSVNVLVVAVLMAALEQTPVQER